MAILPAQISQLRQNLSSRCVGVADQGSGLRRPQGLPEYPLPSVGTRWDQALVINGQVSQRQSLEWAGWRLGEELHAGSQSLLSRHPGLPGFGRAISLMQQMSRTALNLSTFAMPPFRPLSERSTAFTPTPSQRAGPGLWVPQCPPTHPELGAQRVGAPCPCADSSGSRLPTPPPGGGRSAWAGPCPAQG